MNKTPETDAEAVDGIDVYGDPLKTWDYKASKDGEVVLVEFARRIERERDEARRDLVAAEELHRRRFGTLKAEFDAVKKELDDARMVSSAWEQLALREASINGAKLCTKEEAK